MGAARLRKTTLARILATRTSMHFAALSAVFSGMADLRKAFDEAARRREYGHGTLLFVDEIHRFNRAQQDGFCHMWKTEPLRWWGPLRKTPPLN